MAVKAKAEITLATITDIQSLTRYYLVQSSTSSAPAKPTTFTPPSGWTTTEPAYDNTGTYSLYITDRTVFSDGTFAYSDVSLSSSYEAAKEAYNTATAAKSIAERATHSINLTPFGSRSFADIDYWVNGFAADGLIGTYGTVYNTEQLEDGWIHVLIDNTEQTGSASYAGDSVLVATCPSVKPGKLYTILYEIRNNKSVLTGANTYFYIIQRDSKQFWGGAYEELIEGTGTNSTFNLAQMAPDQNVVYRKRFTKYADDGEHAGSNPNALFELPFRTGKGDYADYEVRISLYEGRYLGDYMPYVVSDTTDLNAAINAANTLAQSAKDTADGKITTFYAASTAVPTATTVGDLWIKTDDGNSLWRWNGTSWVSVDNADIQSALTAAGTAQATADSKIVTFAQSSQPTATDVGDIWIDTDNNNKLYRWDGAAWVDVHDPKIAEAYDMAERAGHAINLTPYGSRSFKDTHYWYNTHEHGGKVGDSGVIWNTEQLADGWIHICVDTTGYTGTAKYVSDNVVVRTSPSFKPNTLYTILYEIRNNNSVLAETSANNTQFYIQESGSKVFWGNAITELLEGSGTTGTFYLRTMAPEENATYRKRFTKMSDSGTHAGSNPPYLFQMQHRYAVGDYVDFELRISIYEGRYLGDYMQYVISDTTDIEADINAAQETANGKNTVYYQASAPSGGTYKTNDIWFDTGNGNKMYMWNGSAWTPEEFGNAAISDLSITNAKIANGTIENAKIANLDAGKITAGTMSAARIKGGELSLGGENDTDGVMKVYNADGELVGSFTKEGLEVIAGTIAGWTINPGEFYTEWSQSTRTYKARLSTRNGLVFEETDSETGFENFLRQVIFGASNTAFLHRDRDGFQTAGFIRGIEGTAPGSSVDGGISISPNLLVVGGDGAIYADQLHISTIVNGSYIRQPQLILSGKTSISGGTSQKRATICSIPTAYWSGWLIVPFVTRTYGNSGVAPADNGDFYYAYYNSADHEVDIKLANLLPSGVVFTFDYMIYAVPETT